MEVKIGVPDHMVKSLNNHVYRIFTRGMNWNNVKEYCESLGGHLPAIDTTKGTEELYLLRDMIGSALDEGEMIIVHVRVGGYGLNNVWHWVTSKDFNESPADNYTNAPSKNEDFNYYNGKTSYLILTREGMLIGRSDTATILPFICEWEPTSADFIPFITSGDDEAFRKDKDFSGYLEAPSYMTKFGKTVDLSELHQAWLVYKDPRKEYAQNIDSSKHVVSQGG